MILPTVIRKRFPAILLQDSIWLALRQTGGETLLKSMGKK
jgi:hypothetical protein